MLTNIQKRNIAICNAYTHGQSMFAIATNLNISRTTVRNILKQSNIPKHQCHHHREKPEYSVWNAIKTRCYNPNSVCYPDYGGRGIKMHESWKTSFQTFYESVGPRPSPEHSIHRIDTDKDYAPGNCQWATRYQQSRSKRNNVLITAFGETKCSEDWVRDPRCNISGVHLRLRIKQGMTPEKAITKPSQMSKFKSDTHKQCSRCLTIKTRNEFNIHRPHSPEKHKAMCKDCQHQHYKK